MDKTTVFISSPGDPSVGISGANESIKIWLDFECADGERDRVRDILEVAFGEIYDDSVSVHFGDECADCLLRGGCHTHSCPQNPWLACFDCPQFPK